MKKIYSLLFCATLIAQTEKKVELKHPSFFRGLKADFAVNNSNQRSSNNSVSNNKLSSVNSTYWLPTKEVYYYYSSGWSLVDSTSYYYHTTPGVMAGKDDYNITYDVFTNTQNRDTFSYDSQGNLILSRFINWGSPSYTVYSEKHSSYYPNNKLKSNLNKFYIYDANSCLPGGPGHKLMGTSYDSTGYNAASHKIFTLGKNYNFGTCSWNNHSLDSFYRNSSNLVTKWVSLNAVPPTFTSWNPVSKQILTYNSSDTLIEVIVLQYNSSTMKYDTTGRITNILFHYYDKYDLDAIMVKYYIYQNYTSSGTFSNSASYECYYDSFNNLVKALTKSWNGTAFNDTLYGTFYTYFYKPSTTTGECDSVVVKVKNNPIAPLSFSDKYIYPLGITVTGINDVSLKKEVFRIYPVPAKDILNISSMTEESVWQILITDLQGRTIYTFNNEKPSKQVGIDISGILPGYYGVQITTKDGRKYNSKLLKE